MSRLIVSLLALIWSTSVVLADGFSARAHVDPGRSFVAEDGTGLAIELHLSQAVPWRVRFLQGPDRAVLELREVNWGDLSEEQLVGASAVAGVGLHQTSTGWSQMLLTLNRPLGLDSAEMVTDPVEGHATVSLRLAAVDAAAFAGFAETPKDLAAPERAVDQKDRLRILLDPGHGGVDPGAEVDGINEADLMMTFARELKELLVRSGGYDVFLTRDDDRFVALEARVAMAHQVEADLFVSLHADALPEGHASGATIYTLSEDASDVASAKLAERHDHEDLLNGVDLAGQDDTVARVLMDLARTETQPRSDRLADALVEGIAIAVGRTDSNPRREAGFSVLKSADIPSVLVELGFLTDPRDLSDLKNPAWRAKFAEGMLDGLNRWRVDEAAAEALVRN